MRLRNAFLEQKILFANRFVVLLMLTFGNLMFSQKQSENEDIYKNALGNLYTHPEKTITISEYLSINADSDEQRSKALNLKAEALILQGNNIVALNALLESLHLNDDSMELLQTNLILSDLYRRLGIIPKAKERLNLIESKIHNNPTDTPEKIGLYIDFLTTKSILLCEQKKYDEAIKVIDDNLLTTFSYQFPYQVSKSYNQLAKAYMMNQQWDRSLQYAEKALQLSIKSGLEENFIAYAELDVSKLNFIKTNKQQYQSEIPKLLILSEKVNDIVLKKNIHQFLADLYLSEGDNTNYQLHNLKYLALNESINSAQQKASDLILSLTESELKTKDEQRYKINHILIWIIALAIIILGLVFLFRLKTRKNYNYYKEYISKLKKTHEEEEVIVTNKEYIQEIAKIPQFIPEKTEQILLEKLLFFEKGTDYQKKSHPTFDGKRT